MEISRIKDEVRESSSERERLQRQVYDLVAKNRRLEEENQQLIKLIPDNTLIDQSLHSEIIPTTVEIEIQTDNIKIKEDIPLIS